MKPQHIEHDETFFMIVEQGPKSKEKNHLQSTHLAAVSGGTNGISFSKC